MLNSVISGNITAGSFLACTAASVIIGILLALVYSVRSRYSQSFLVSLALLPSIVELIIMLVNGNIGAGVAVAGTFSLVRFRSAAGNAKEIVFVFFAVAVGLATGMGYIGIAAVFFVIVSLFALILTFTGFGKGQDKERTLRITIPEDLDYEGIFEPILKRYTKRADLETVRTKNMGTVYELTYRINLKNTSDAKKMMDDIRCRNGNLPILLGKSPVNSDETL